MRDRENELKKRRENINKIRISVSLITIIVSLTLVFTLAKQQVQIQNINNVKSQQQAKKNDLDKEIKKLSNDFKNLDNLSLIEKYARKRLGMVKPDEVLVKDEKDKPKKDQNYTPSPTFENNMIDK